MKIIFLTLKNLKKNKVCKFIIKISMKKLNKMKMKIFKIILNQFVISKQIYMIKKKVLKLKFKI